MKKIINLESIWRRSLKTMGKYYQWLFWQQRNFPTRKMKKMLDFYKQFVEQGNLCFDIGANMGSRVATFLLLKAKVVALEPQKKCVQELEKVFGKYDVTVIPKGVGSKNETKEFFLADDSLISSFNQEWIEGMKSSHFQKKKWDKTEKIEIVTLDMLMKEYGVPEFIKIDTEGFELEVIKGLSTPVKALSFEYTLPHQKEQVITCVELLDSLYKKQAVFNICRDESYAMKFDNWMDADKLKIILKSDEFNKSNYGVYGDIYVRMLN
ncbi:MAG TPA: FkbM family methyltransferase [Chitinophagaceae bacterium]|nr:FkbM family methyltransferase [Chitinophagaceae bacterium]